MQFQMQQVQQLQQRINQLQRELSSISSQLSSISSMSSQSFTGNIGGMGMYGGQSFAPGNIASYTPSHSSKAGVGDSGQSLGGSVSGIGGYGSMGSGISMFSGQPGSIASYTPAHSPKAGIGDSQQQSFGVSDYNYPMGGYSGYSGYGSGQNISTFTGPSATAGFSEVSGSPTGRPDYGMSGSQQPFRLGQY
ncbi:MAG: hypothetical protein GX750_10445 [Clostridia bacterium]|nr:hypothetical protein [Clostridia bacterium]